MRSPHFLKERSLWQTLSHIPPKKGERPRPLTPAEHAQKRVDAMRVLHEYERKEASGPAALKGALRNARTIRDQAERALREFACADYSALTPQERLTATHRKTYFSEVLRLSEDYLNLTPQERQSLMPAITLFHKTTRLTEDYE
jgi:hypothetical protein